MALQTKGPTLLVVNHPNSFFDAIVLGALFKQPIYYLARGDVFKKPFHRKLLELVNAIPIYRLSEGKENLHLNNNAFKAVHKIWQQNGIVLIFIEGVCKLTHQLQPLKKGAARMLFTAWQQNIQVQVLPIALGYTSFTKIPFSLTVNLGQITNKQDFDLKYSLPNFSQSFNAAMFQKLKSLIRVPVEQQVGFTKQLLYALHYPLFKSLKLVAYWLTKATVFYHSVLFALLAIVVPLYWLLVWIVLSIVF